MSACMHAIISVVSDSAVLWTCEVHTITCQGPLLMGFFRQEYWSGLPCPPLEDPLNPRIKPASFMSPALADGFFTTSTT